ncbi:hypothetical protein NPIL_534101 [Nephila pilipes]|uniref:Uncharacterized protein n=1 Tax=Nephila pilipes TaxID=299642 RepID=A0A8X6P7B5_NEPPI|nr:hypothetical protein NPIL_534101 [Nephila pilipes]
MNSETFCSSGMNFETYCSSGMNFQTFGSSGKWNPGMKRNDPKTLRSSGNEFPLKPIIVKWNESETFCSSGMNLKPIVLAVE